MKKLFNVIITIGSILVLGAAGSADITAGNLLQPVLVMLLGITVTCFGIYCKERYRRHLKRCASASKRRKAKLCANNSKELVNV